MFVCMPIRCIHVFICLYIQIQKIKFYVLRWEGPVASRHFSCTYLCDGHEAAPIAAAVAPRRPTASRQTGVRRPSAKTHQKRCHAVGCFGKRRIVDSFIKGVDPNLCTRLTEAQIKKMIFRAVGFGAGHWYENANRRRHAA